MMYVAEPTKLKTFMAKSVKLLRSRFFFHCILFLIFLHLLLLQHMGITVTMVTLHSHDHLTV